MDIANLPTRELRAEALARVPAEWRELVQAHVVNAFRLRAVKRESNIREESRRIAASKRRSRAGSRAIPRR
jgi:hypothetical protein